MKTIIINSSEDEREAFYEMFVSALSSTFKDPITTELFFLATVEAINNAAEHGNQNRFEKPISIQYGLFRELAVISIGDQGLGFEPVFPNLKQVQGHRGRGLALIKKYTDIIFFNSKGNQITLIKGRSMKTITTDYGTIHYSNEGMTVIVTDLNLGKGAKQSKHLIDFFELCEKFGPAKKQFFFDLSHIHILSSTAWGKFFTENENHIITLFNVNVAIKNTAEAMGVEERQDCEQFLVYEGAHEVIDILPIVLGEEFKETKELFVLSPSQ